MLANADTCKADNNKCQNGKLKWLKFGNLEVMIVSLYSKTKTSFLFFQPWVRDEDHNLKGKALIMFCLVRAITHFKGW
jgi:hypothetical protein